MEIILSIVLGYGFSVVAGSFLIKLVVETMWKAIGSQQKNKPYPWQAGITGVIERTLYTASMQIGQHGFIAVWLALKVASGWKRWGEGEDEKPQSGRAIYHIFLAGTGLSIAYAATGWKMIDWYLSEDYMELIALPLVLVVGTLSIWLWVKIGTYMKRQAPIAKS